MNVRVFRVLIVLGASTYILLFLLSFAAPYLYSQETLDLLTWNGYDAIIQPDPVYAWLSLILFIGASVALYRFSLTSRRVFTALLMMNWFFSASCGVVITTGVENLIAFIYGISSSGVLVMAWIPPLSDRFGRD